MLCSRFIVVVHVIHADRSKGGQRWHFVDTREANGELDVPGALTRVNLTKKDRLFCHTIPSIRPEFLNQILRSTTLNGFNSAELACHTTAISEALIKFSIHQIPTVCKISKAFVNIAI